jgi:hypothetical protein
MPFCRRDCDDAEAFAKPADEGEHAPVWREPPGRLGEYVRRVKRLEALKTAPPP